MKIDEPAFPDRDSEADTLDDERIEDRVRTLVSSEPYAVLCTQGEGQPYGSLVAFACSSDLTAAVFATPKTTRKYRLLSECDGVALVIDNRSQFTEEMMRVEAVTATGRAVELDRGAEFDRCANLLLARHPHLESFVYAASCALLRIDIVRFFHVWRFQEVRQWVPPRT